MEKQTIPNFEKQKIIPNRRVELDFLKQRAIEAVLWGIPAVNLYLMYEEMVRKLKGDFNQVVFWPKLLDWRNQTLTPNPDVIYIMPFFNTQDAGPMVLEIPPADDGVLNGSVMNVWQAAIEDIGPGGVDKGKGGKYLILPPGFDLSKVPAGYIPMPSDTYRGYAIIRSMLKSGSDDDLNKAVTYSERIKLYPLSEASNPTLKPFLNASEILFDSKITYDIRFFEILNRFIQDEPWLERDRAMIDKLKTIGIQRGKDFDPDRETIKILNEAVNEAKEWMEILLEAREPYYKHTHWFFPLDEDLKLNVFKSFKVQDSYPLDNRSLIYSIAYFSAKHLGESQFYLFATKDNKDKHLEGHHHYKLNVPANVPVSQYWSMTVYNRETHTFIENAKWVGRSSLTPGLQRNLDGSVDIYFGPTPPNEGETNWIPTDPNGRFEVLARFYGNQKPLMDKSWEMNDIERINGIVRLLS